MASKKYGRNLSFDEDDYEWSCDDDDDDTESYGETEEDEFAPPGRGFSLADAFQTSATISPEDAPPPASNFSLAGASQTPAAIKSEEGSDDGINATPRSATRVPYTAVNMLDQKAAPKQKLPKLRRYYGQRPSVDLLSALSDDALVLIARFLPLRSVAALGCVNRSLDVALSSDFLYCRGVEGDDAKPSSGESAPDLLLPSLGSVPVLLAGNERPKGVARKFAFEADAYSRSRPNYPGGKSTERSFHLVDQVYNVRANNVTFVNQNTLAYTTDDSAEVTTRNVLTSETVSSGPPNARLCLRSAFGSGTSQGRSLCATVTADTGSRSRRHLSLMELSLPSGDDAQSHRVQWHREMNGMFLGNISLEFSHDNEMLFVGTAAESNVLDTRSGKEVWSLEEVMETPLFHEKLVIGTVGDCVKIFDVRRKSRKHIACTALPSEGALRPTQFAVRQGQLWMSMHYGLHRSTDFIMRTIADAHQGQREPIDFKMKQVAKQMHQQPVLATGNDKLYVACGGSIAAYDSRSLLSKSWATYKACPIERMVVDNTKLVYTRQTPEFYNYGIGTLPFAIDVLPIDAFAQTPQPEAGASFSVAQPYFPRMTRTGCSGGVCSCSVDSIALGGTFIAASYSYSTKYQSGGGEIRVLDMQRSDGDTLSSYEAAKARSERWEEYESMKQREECEARGYYRWEKMQQRAADEERAEKAAEEERQRDAMEERKQRIIARKDAKKQRNRERKSKTRTASKQMAQCRGEKDFR